MQEYYGGDIGMSKVTSKKLVKARGNRRDTVEAMAVCIASLCNNNCANCSGGGSWHVQERTYLVMSIGKVSE